MKYEHDDCPKMQEKEREKKIFQVSEYEQLLQSVGCRTFYVGEENQGFQRLLFDPNSGVIFSIEFIPSKKQAEIRVSNSEKNVFSTASILEGISCGVPLFSQYKTHEYWNLPLISLEEEYHLPSCPPMHARILALPGAPDDADEAYYQVGQVPGVDSNLILFVEQQYCHDVEKYNEVANQILQNKIETLPVVLQKHYHYFPEKKIDVYNIPKQLRR